MDSLGSTYTKRCAVYETNTGTFSHLGIKNFAEVIRNTKISVTLSSVIIAIIVCKLLIFSTLKLQHFSLITKFSDTYISSNSR